MIGLQEWIACFFVYSFLGWIFESIYKSIYFKKIINTGFLIGPIVPVYGFGALTLLIIDQYISPVVPLVFRLILYTITANVIEYYTAVLLEEVFHVKMWDYSNMKFNLKGRICLLHGIYWTGLSLLVLKIFHPFIKELISIVNSNYLFVFNNILMLYILIDFLYSTKFMNSILQHVLNIKNNFINIPKLNFEKVSIMKQRILESFPNINKNININLKENLMKIFKNILPINNKIKLLEIQEDEDEFNRFSEDIINHDKFIELKMYKHHDSSIYDHVLKVSKLSYKLAKILKLDVKSTVRGALLHDFFFYDWRKERPIVDNKKRLHAFNHSLHAYHNAKKYFNLNEIEKDIILKHMFPLTITLPQYKETFLVLIVDKIVSSKEFIIELIKP